MSFESVYLSGSEDVLNAGHRMKEAGAEMSRAANQIWEAAVRFREDVDRLADLMDYVHSSAGREERGG